MVEVLAILKSFWALILSAIAFIVWLVRLEAKAINNGKRLEHLEEKLDKHAALSVQTKEDIFSELRTMKSRNCCRLENSPS